MKNLILISVIVFGIQAFAEHHEGDDKNFSTHKAEVLKNVDERIAKLTEHKTCVSAASDKEALKKCHESMKDFREEKRGEMKDKREEMREKRKEMRKGKKSE